jgi:hypothetical protein
MAKMYTLEELLKLNSEHAHSGRATKLGFLEWLYEKETEEEFHPIARIIGGEVTGEYYCAKECNMSKAISKICKKHDLRLWPEVTIEMIVGAVAYMENRENRDSDVGGLLVHLRNTYSVGGVA